MLTEISWSGDLYLKQKNENNNAENYFLQESLKSLMVRTEYSKQQCSSMLLIQINQNDVQKMSYIFKSSVKYPNQAIKCVFCKRTNFFKEFVMCKACANNYHLDCFNIMKENQKGSFFHENITELKTCFLEKARVQIQSKDAENSVYWLCQKCTHQIFQKDRLKIELKPPFEIQTLPQTQLNKIYSTCGKNRIFGDLTEYCIPENFEIALIDRNLVYQEECVFLSSAKGVNNSIAYSIEPIDVFLY